jgi:hypothetical protein
MPTVDTPNVIDFTDQEKKVGRVLYYILVICIIASVAGFGWTIADIIKPQGKLQSFLTGNAGLNLVLIGVSAFILFLMLIAFYGMRRRGTDMITRVIFTAKQIYKDMKVPKMAQFTTGGLMVSIFVMAIGGFILMIQILLDSVFNTQAAAGEAITVGGVTESPPAILMFLSRLTSGELFMIIAVFCLCMTLIVVLFAWLGSAGNIFFARAFLKIAIPPESYAMIMPADTNQIKTARQSFLILGFFFAFAGIALYASAMVYTIGGTLATVSSSSIEFHQWLESISFFAGFGAVVLMIALFFALVGRQKLLSLVILASFILGILTAIYVDVWRPLGDAGSNPWDAATLLNFQALVIGLECIAIGLYVADFVLQFTPVKNLIKTGSPGTAKKSPASKPDAEIGNAAPTETG